MLIEFVVRPVGAEQPVEQADGPKVARARKVVVVVHPGRRHGTERKIKTRVPKDGGREADREPRPQRRNVRAAQQRPGEQTQGFSGGLKKLQQEGTKPRKPS